MSPPGPRAFLYSANPSAVVTAVSPAPASANESPTPDSSSVSETESAARDGSSSFAALASAFLDFGGVTARTLPDATVSKRATPSPMRARRVVLPVTGSRTISAKRARMFAMLVRAALVSVSRARGPEAVVRDGAGPAGSPDEPGSPVPDEHAKHQAAHAEIVQASIGRDPRRRGFPFLAK